MISLNGAAPDLGQIEDLLLDIDPLALVDVDPASGRLRLSANILDRELHDVLARSGCPVKPRQIERVPSTCCGGCST